MAHQSDPLPINMLEILEHYASLGVHRTGTDVDHATTAWLEGVLADMGARVSRHSYGFPMVQGAASLSASFNDIPLMPLYYAGSGVVETDKVHVAALSLEDGHDPAGVDRDLAAIVAQALAVGADLAVVATRCTNNSLCAINRAPEEALDFPICLAPGHAFERLKAGTPQVRFEVSITTGSSDNLVAELGESDDPRPPLVITTPTSGWFTCAGERGSGLAVALSVAQTIAADHPVLLVLTSGHELGYLGGRRFVEQFEREIAGVLHIGSCVADKAAFDEQRGTFQPGALGAVSNLANMGFVGVEATLAPLGIALRRPERPLDPACWVGESELWASRGTPMLSLAGASPNFHTPEDTFECAASAALLEAMACQVLACASMVLAMPHKPEE
ncbi:MAG: hypothetical protein ACKVH7_09960 [Alphaproteobacteria bacterium]|jgi:hypothetical protein